MHPALVITLAAAAALPLGLSLRHDLNQLSYRTADENELPHPGPRWWVVLASVVAAGAVSAATILNDDPMVYVSLLPLAVSGPWLAAVDLDVMRIPNRILGLTAAVTMLAVVGNAVAAREWLALLLPVTTALATAAVFAGVHLSSRGGVGFGDVKLAALIGLALGAQGAVVVWVSVLTGSVAALTWSRARHHAGPIPYAPWLLGGVLAATSISAALRQTLL